MNELREGRSGRSRGLVESSLEACYRASIANKFTQKRYKMTQSIVYCVNKGTHSSLLSVEDSSMFLIVQAARGEAHAVDAVDGPRGRELGGTHGELLAVALFAPGGSLSLVGLRCELLGI